MVDMVDAVDGVDGMDGMDTPALNDSGGVEFTLRAKPMEPALSLFRPTPEVSNLRSRG